MKKIMNQPENIVAEMCNGIVLAHPELAFDRKYKIIKKKAINENKVSLISGGGSGHEPAHAGFVGFGMLDGAICGDIFASPSQVKVYQGIKETASSKGALLVIKNYSGDVMNFKNALHLAKEDGLDVDYVLVDDDIAVEDSLYTVGRRGVAGTVFVHKIAGAAAQQGKSLSEVKSIAQKVVNHVRSIGFALSSCTVPAAGKPTFELGTDEIEYGVGIHGEPGIQKTAMTTSKELAGRMVDALVRDLGIKSNGEQEVAVLVNGFGGTPLQELYLFNNDVMEKCQALGLKVRGVFVGNYMTSLDMEGASLSLLKLDEQLRDYLFDPCDTPGFKVTTMPELSHYEAPLAATITKSPSFVVETNEQWAKVEPQRFTLQNMIFMVDKMAEIIVEKEVEFCELDTHAGDGDFGMSISKGFRWLKRDWHDLTSNDVTTIGQFLESCSLIIMEHCGGASGPIWGSAFRSAGKLVGDKTSLTTTEFANMIEAAVKGIQATGERSFGRGAVVGDKTLIDALIPCATTWQEEAQKGTDFAIIFKKAAQEAVAGAESTKDMVARMGRAGSVGERSLGYPDAGAYGLGVIFTELAKTLKG